MDQTEALICTHLQHEGLGSLYERIVLSRWFRALAARYGYSSVVEYGCSITKGYDNSALLAQGIPVTVADAQIDQIRRTWMFPQQPVFSSLPEAPAADLVWNFAQLQMEPHLLDAMTRLAKRHILVFVPNILNPGTPIHLAYHLLTRTRCHHAERGSVRLRTRTGLLRHLASHNIRVIDSGYIDAPPIPDIAFSIRELKTTLGRAPANGAGNGATTEPIKAWRRVETMTRFEESRLVSPFKPVVGHHIFALGEVAQ
jgi:hypothetical protein